VHARQRRRPIEDPGAIQPRLSHPLTPTSGSWLNLLEAFFSISTRQALRRGNFPTVADLIAAIQRCIDAWNDRCTPFAWTKDPDTIIAKAIIRGTATQRRHQIRTTNDRSSLPRSSAIVDSSGMASS
jgi:hypothetical protein